MTSKKPSITLTRSSNRSLGDKIYADAARKARRMAEHDAALMLQIANGIIASELPDRSGHRHKENTTHMSQSLAAKVDQPTRGKFPISAKLTIKPGVNAAKVAALEYGVKGNHTITAGTKTPGAKYLRHGREPGMLRKEKLHSVVWKPTGQIALGYHFMKRAHDAVVRQRRASR